MTRAMDVSPDMPGNAYEDYSPAPPVRDPSPVLSVILATLNERENLPDLIRQVAAQELPPFEIVVVDDGSTDGTREYLLNAATTDRRIRPIFNDGPQTLTPALCQGIEGSRGRFIVVMDADLQHPPREVPRLVAELVDGASVVVATRYATGGTAGGRPPQRAILSRGAELIARLALKSARSSSDPMSGFFGFRREIYQSIGTPRPGYKLLLYVLAMVDGQRVAEVPYAFSSRKGGESKIAHGFEFIWIFLAEVMSARRLQGYLRAEMGRGTLVRAPTYGVDAPVAANDVGPAAPDTDLTDSGDLLDAEFGAREVPTFSLSRPEDRPSSAADRVGLEGTTSLMRPYR